MKKKSFFEKVGLVESTETEVELSAEELAELVDNAGSGLSADAIEVPEDLNIEGLLSIEDIYEKFKLNEIDNSIFKIEEFSQALPDTLTTELKRNSVLGILNASHLDIGKLTDDANNRLEALSVTLYSSTEETNKVVENSKEEIKELEARIEELKGVINDREKLHEEQEKVIKAEQTHVQEIVDFIISE